MDITTKTDIELKALAYDFLSIIEVNSKNLQIVNAELQKRNTPLPGVLGQTEPSDEKE